jgi:uncharacterized protein
MKTDFGKDKSSANAQPPAASSGHASLGRRKLEAFVSRRRLLMFAAGGLASGVAAGRVVKKLPVAPVTDRAAAASVEIPVLPRPMEEEPLPADIHLPSPLRTPLVDEARRQAMLSPPPLPGPALRPAEPPGGEPAWLANARPYEDTGARPRITIVIDDLGLNVRMTHRAVALDAAVTLAFMTYADKLADWTGAARAARHELLLHVPMQPLSARIDPGPRALAVGLTDAEILDRLRWGLGRMSGYVGINNHMGSRFTEDRDGMSVVMTEIEARGLLYLDSVTTGRSVCAPAAASRHLPFAERNVFLDNEATDAAISRQIAAVEAVARRHGSAIAIGHPHEATLAVLASWLPGAAARGVAVVPLTSVMRRSGVRA